MKRNAPNGLSDIQLSQFEKLIRKKHKSVESEENDTMKVVNALPIDQKENLTDQPDYYATRMAESN